MKKIFVFVLTLIWAIPVFAWHTNTHLQMTRDALALMPADFQKIFTEHQKYVEAGIKDPDEVIRDWSNHYYIPATPEGGALDRIDKIVAIVQMKFKNGSTIDASKQLCYLAHYIADLWTPEDYLKQNTAGNRDFVSNSNIVVFFEGYSGPIENIHDYLKSRAEWRWQLENSTQIYTLLYSEAVNDIARVWLTLWQQNGNKVPPEGPSVLEHKAASLDVNFDRLLQEEKYNAYSYYTENTVMDAYNEHQRELQRLNENVNPSNEQLYAKAEIRNDQTVLSKLAPDAPFRILETSLKTVGDKNYFVARLMNKSGEEIPSIAFMCPGVRGPAAFVKALKPGQVAKVEATLPANATKDEIQLIFASPAK